MSFVKPTESHSNLCLRYPWKSFRNYILLTTLDSLSQSDGHLKLPILLGTHVGISSRDGVGRMARTKLTLAAEREGTVQLWGSLKKYEIQEDTGSEKRRKLVYTQLVNHVI